MKYTRLGDLLIGTGVINHDQLQQALAIQKKKGQRLGETLVSEGIITERQLIDALTMQLGIDYVDLTDVDINPNMTKLVSKNIAKRYSVVPVRTSGDDLYLAMSDPLNFIATEEVKASSRKHIIPMIATQSSIDHAISALYDTEGAKRAIREMQKEGIRKPSYAIGTQTSKLSDEDSTQAPSIRLVDNIIERGISDRASDIHIEPQEDRVTVRLRIDGILHNVFKIPKELQPSLTSRIKIMCGMDVTERRVPQDGRAVVRLHMKEVDLRASTLPTVHGEKIVLRILDRDQRMDTAEGLGFYGDNLDRYNALLENHQGIVLVVGPTGSGKSSTLYAMVQHLNTEAVNIVTLEDPVEYNIEGVNQVQIDEKTGTTFASGLRAVLRQDPDIISVGEIRDTETANIAMRAAVTGHLVFSTVHTGDARSTLDRLDDIDVPPYMVATALKGIISQRLLRRICPNCRHAYTPSPNELESLGMDPDAKDITFYRGEGCSECFNTGYQGRTVAAEILHVTPRLSRAIHDRSSRDEFTAAVSASGFHPIAENCRDLVLKGITTSDEVLRTVFTAE